MKLITQILVFSLLFANLQAREFTLSEGKVEGEITSVANGLVTLRLPDGKAKPIPMASLTPDDLNYAKQWWEQNRKLWFEIKAAPKKLERGEMKSAGSGLESRMDRWKFTVEVRNSDKVASPELSVDYWMHLKNNLKGGSLRPKRARQRFPRYRLAGSTPLKPARWRLRCSR